jgi:hypothetical protein
MVDCLLCDGSSCVLILVVEVLEDESGSGLVLGLDGSSVLFLFCCQGVFCEC